MPPQIRPPRAPGTGWASVLARFCMAVLVFETVSGLAITVSPFHAAVQWSVLAHTLVGTLTLLPLAWYCATHWYDYRRYAWSNVVLLGYVALIGLAVCCLSGVVVTWQGWFGLRTSQGWRQAHLISTLVTLAGLVPHVGLVYWKSRLGEAAGPARRYAGHALIWPAAGLAVVGVLSWSYSGTRYVNEFPEDYQFLYGADRPFAPSLATTDTGGALDARVLAGSESCGTAGCHEQIVREWKPSAHRYAAMDTVFQGIQQVMAQQNGPESTRYCGGCHDPISLFSGSKNIFVEELTGAHGYREGISCLACHAIRATDIQGNANYTVTQPREYLWQWDETGWGRRLRDFLIRAYPAEHNQLSKRMFKQPEYCAACHKQFIDQEVNRVGWVQLQNQYDNWAASHWNQKGDPTRTLECRECHMPLVESTDPAAGDGADYNRSPDDGKHRSHRFIASNQLLPRLLELEGWREQLALTERWLRGEQEIPEIRDKWSAGPIVTLALEVPEAIEAGEPIPLRVVMTSNKVGHDFPTGPLDIIQSWVEVRVTDPEGREIFRSGGTDENHFIEPGAFMFKAEPVDQFGNLIDRHNLWEMVGVRYRRALFPGYSDTAQYLIQCPSAVVPGESADEEAGRDSDGKWNDARDLALPAAAAVGDYEITASLRYRKVDQFLLNYLFGATNRITSPVTEISRAAAKVSVVPAKSAAAAAAVRSTIPLAP